MVTTWRDNYNAGSSTILSTQVKEALISCSNDIQGEAIASIFVPPAVPTAINAQELHNRRSRLAYRILNGDVMVESQMSHAVAVNLDLYLSVDGLSILKATGDTAPSKAEIKNSVSAVFSYFALDCKAA